MSDNFALAADQLRELDRDRYTASLIVPPQHRPSVQAIFAFSAEVAAVRERVTEPGPGEIRLQWWVDALEGQGHGAVASNPVADALLKSLSSNGLPGGPLVRLLAARRFDLYNDPMTDIGQFEGYAGETVSVLYQYAAMIIAQEPAEVAADAAGHLGVAQALTGHLRAFAYNAARGQLFLPLSIFTANGVQEAQIYAGQSSLGLKAALDQVLDLAHDHAAKARAAIIRLPKPLKPAFASMALVDQDLKLLGRAKNDAFSPPPPVPPFRRLWAVTWWAMRNG